MEISPDITINIHVNDITSLDTSYISPDAIKDLVTKCNRGNINVLVGDYIKDILCNKEHAVKYVSKRDQIFNSKVKDENGNIVDLVKNLKDACSVLEQPILDVLQDYLNNYKEHPEYNNDKSRSIWEELKKALKSTLKTDSLNEA